MRILSVHPGPSFSVADVHRGWTDALIDLGLAVADFNLNDRLAFYEKALGGGNDPQIGEQAALLGSHSLNAAIYELWPEVLLITFGKFVASFVYELARLRGMKVVLLATESPYEDELQLQMARYCDLVILNDPTNLEKFREITKAEYIGHAYNPALHCPGPVLEEARSEFCFVGTGYPSRIEFLEQVDWSGIDVALAGNWLSLDDDSRLRKFLAHDIDRCADNAEAVDLYRATQVSANLYRTEGDQADGWSMGPREIELAACGTFFLRDPRPEGDEVFPMLPTFAGPGDFSEKLRWFLSHPSERQSAANQARAAIADRTFTNSAQRLLKLLS